MTIAGAIRVRPESSRRKPKGPNSISVSRKSATAASVESNGRYADASRGSARAAHDTIASRAVLRAKPNDPPFELLRTIPRSALPTKTFFSRTQSAATFWSGRFEIGADRIASLPSVGFNTRHPYLQLATRYLALIAAEAAVV